MTTSLLGLTAVLAAVYLAHAYRQRRRSERTASMNTADAGALEPLAFGVRHSWSEHRATFLNFGFVFALGCVSLAFEYTSDARAFGELREPELRPEVEIEVVRTPTVRPPAPPPPPVESREVSLALIDLVPDEVPTAERDVTPDIVTTVDTLSDAAPVALLPPPPAPARPVVEEPEFEPVYPVVGQMPMFPGCDADGASVAEQQACAQEALLAFLYRKLRYPAVAKENRVQGTAVVTFVVEKDGSISGAEVVRDPGAGLGAEALRVVETFPTWIPGRQRGRAVRVQFNLPVKYRLE